MCAAKREREREFVRGFVLVFRGCGVSTAASAPAGSWESTYHISRVIARSVGASNAMTVLEAPMPGVSAPTKDYKFDIKPQEGGRLAVEGSK
mmetsp:Transcript_35367/g.63072  ORF Transcript_35367/g.63072 Transcript_35367/m.63072 type:complete len:92 (-) Transcript_35367:153-428(-)